MINRTYSESFKHVYYMLERISFLGNVSNDVTHCEQRSSTLKTGDLVFIITFVDVHRVYVCNVKDNNNGFHSFIKSINTYCSTGIYSNLTSKLKLPINKTVFTVPLMNFTNIFSIL